MGYYIGNALVSALEGEALLACDVRSARELFLQVAQGAPAGFKGVFGGPLNTFARRAIDPSPEPGYFGASMIHAPSFGVGSWMYAPDPNLIPRPGSPEVTALSKIVAAHPALKVCAPHFTGNVFTFAEGVRRRLAFYLAFEAGMLARTPSVYAPRDRASCPPVHDRTAFSIFLNLAAGAIFGESAELPWIEARLREAAAHRAGTLHEDARIALNALLIQERRLVERRARGQGLYAWTTVASSVDFTRPEEVAGARCWLLEAPCPFSGEVSKVPERVEGMLVTISFDSEDHWPPRKAPGVPPFEARLEAAELEARALEVLIATDRPAQQARSNFLISLQALGLSGTEAHPSEMPVAPAELRSYLEAQGPRFASLAAYARAAAELAVYFASAERASELGAQRAPVPVPVTAGKVSIEWFRRGLREVPRGHSRFSWTAVCEGAIAFEAAEPIVIREGGRSYRLRLEGTALVGVEWFDAGD